MSDINPYDYIVAKQKMQDALEGAISLRGRIFDLTDSLNGTAWEYNVWSHMDATAGNHLVQAHGLLSRAIEALENSIDSTL